MQQRKVEWQRTHNCQIVNEERWVKAKLLLESGSRFHGGRLGRAARARLAHHANVAVLQKLPKVLHAPCHHT